MRNNGRLEHRPHISKIPGTGKLSPSDEEAFNEKESTQMREARRIMARRLLLPKLLREQLDRQALLKAAEWFVVKDGHAEAVRLLTME